MAKSRNVANLIAANLLPASSTITASMIVDGAITASKLASGAVTSTKLDTSVSTLLPLTINGVTVTDSSYTAQADTAINPLGGYIKLTGTGFATGCQVYINNTPATVTTYVSATEVRAQVPAFSAGYYHIYIQNTNGQAGLRVNGLYVSASPSWSTSSSIGGSLNVPFGIQLAATSDTSVTYSLAVGSTLPTGLSLTSLGYLSGTVSGLTQTTAYTIGIVATDSENQTNTRTFTLTITVSEPYFPYTTLLLLGNNAGTTTQNNTFVDTSVNAATPTRFGNVTQGSFSPFTQTGWSTYFNGSTDYLTVPTNSAFQFGTGDFTVEFWVYKLAAANGPIVDARGSATAVPWAFYIDANNYPYFYDGTSLTSTVAIVNNQWNHVAAARSSGTLKIFVNGVQGYSNTVTTALNPAATFYIGGQNFSTSVYTSGHISNLRIVKGQALYTGAFTPSTSPLTTTSQGATAANVSILTGQANRHLDNSINNFAITASGSPAIQSFSPFTPSGLYSQVTNGGSMYFDGAGDYLSLASSALYGFSNGAFTMECWVYVTSTTAGNRGVLNAGTANSASNCIGMYIEGATNTYRIYNGTSTISLGTMVLNTWTHLALVRVSTATNQTFGYVNGVLAATTTFSDTFVSPAPLYIGTSVYGYLNNAEYFNGYISDARVLKGVAAYSGNFTPPAATLNTSQNQSGNLVAFSSSATSALVKGTNAAIFDATSKNVLETIGSVATQTTVYKYGGASIYFPGTASFLFAPSSPGFAFGTGDYTIECWIYLSVLGTYRRIWWFSDDNDNTNVNASNQIQFGGASQTAITGSTLSVNTWYHLAYVRSSGSGKLYLDGAQVGSTTSNSYNSAARSFYIGATNTGANPWSGYIDDFRITKGVARFTANFTPATSELTAN